jgi:hypothetical protein
MHLIYFRDGRLLPGDFILEINEHWLKGVASEQVATVLRGCGLHVRLVVARPVEPTDLASIPGSNNSSSLNFFTFHIIHNIL